MKQLIYKSWTYIIVLLVSSVTYSQAQFFVDAFDRQYLTTDPTGAGTSILSGLNIGSTEYDLDIANGQGTFQTLTGPMMRALIMMYKATNDSQYLDQFITNSKNVIDRRDDKLQGTAPNVHPFPMKYNVDGTEYTKVFIPGIDPSRPNAATWSLLYHTGDHDFVWFAASVYSGEIIFPMTEFIHLIRNEEPVLGSYPCSLPGFATYNDYSNWLEGEVKLTIDAHTDSSFDYRTGDHRRDVFRLDKLEVFGPNIYGCHSGVFHKRLAQHNFSAAMGRAFAILYDCTSDISLKADLQYILTKQKQNWYTYAFLENNGTGYNWIHSMQLSNLGEGTEEISHGAYAVHVAQMCNEFGITDSGGSELYSDAFVQKCVNTFITNMYDKPLNIWNGVDGSDDLCTGCDETNISKRNQFKRKMIRGTAGWLPLSNTSIGYASTADYRDRDIYQVSADIYLEQVFQHPEGWKFTGAIPMALASQAYYSKLNQDKLNPISANRKAGAGSMWKGAEGGDIDNDGVDEVVAVRNSLIGPKIVTYKLQADGTHSYMDNTILGPSMHTPNYNFEDVAVGNFNPIHVGDEILSVTNSAGNIYMHELNGGILSEKMAFTAPSGSSNWRGIASGDFIPGNGKDECVVVRNLDGRFFLMEYLPGSNSLTGITSWYGPISSPDWGGISCGDLDGDGRKDDIVAVDNSTGGIFTFLYDQTSGTFLNGPAYTASSSLSNWTDVTVGKFCSNGQLRDDIVVHRGLNGDLTVLRIEGGTLKPIAGSFFTAGDQLDVLGAGNFKVSNGKNELVCLRNIDGDILTFNIDLNCETIQVDNKSSEKSSEAKLNDATIPIELFPNPTSEILNVRFDLGSSALGEFIVYDLLGNEVHSIQLSKEKKMETLNISQLSKGTYFYSCFVEGVLKSKGKFVVQ
ncbi:MAG: T9SS type A sorting domain-containing protein [Crocinitomicaceae bacterium]|nr:T9SS type A sorting domain-containing protein [Crocinitomicaceae bacterium]